MLKQWYSKRCVRKLNELKCEAKRKVTERHKYCPDCGVWCVTFSTTIFWEEHTFHRLFTTYKYIKKLSLFAK